MLRLRTTLILTTFLVNYVVLQVCKIFGKNNQKLVINCSIAVVPFTERTAEASLCHTPEWAIGWPKWPTYLPRPTNDNILRNIILDISLTLFAFGVELIIFRMYVIRINWFFNTSDNVTRLSCWPPYLKTILVAAR